jgi:Na+/alanine symporter
MNLLFFAALLVGIMGAVISRARAKGMALAMFATAAALGLAFVVASAAPTDEAMVKHSAEAFGTGVFAALFLCSAALFRKAARESYDPR